MLKKVLALMLALFCLFGFAACGSEAPDAQNDRNTTADSSGSDNSKNTATDQNATDRYQVTQAEWEQLFSLENLAFRSNLMIRCTVPANDWEASLSFDSGKIYVTGLGLRKGREGETLPEQRTDGYLHMKSLTQGMVWYDNYYYWGKWVKEAREETLASVFLGYGLFEHDYRDFEFDAQSKEYRMKASASGNAAADTENEAAASDYWTVKIVDKKIVQVKMVRQGAECIYDYSEYGNISVTFPQIDD